MKPEDGFRLVKESYKNQVFTGVDQRPWGFYEILVENSKVSLKFLHVSGVLSLQSHKKRSELWYVLEGPVYVELGTLEDFKSGKLEKFKMEKGSWVGVPVNMLHRLSNVEGIQGKVLEILLGEYDEKDIIRYEDIYGRS